MLLEYIERVRSQPKEVRRRIAYVWSTVLTGIIVLLWISVIIGRNYAEGDSDTSQMKQDEQPASRNTSTQFNAANDFLNVPTTPSFMEGNEGTQPATYDREGTTTQRDVIAPVTVATSTKESSSTPKLWP